jgi:hypothetical protein
MVTTKLCVPDGTAPGQLRGNVLTAGAEDATYLRHRQLLAIPQVAAGQ